MAKNLKALTDEELDYIRKAYIFDVYDKYIVVSCSGYNRRTLHDIDKPFLLTTKARKITITVQAINMWLEKYKGKYSLVEVQNAINYLIVTYQPVNDEEIEKQLKCKSVRIQEI